MFFNLPAVLFIYLPWPRRASAVPEARWSGDIARPPAGQNGASVSTPDRWSRCAACLCMSARVISISNREWCRAVCAWDLWRRRCQCTVGSDVTSQLTGHDACLHTYSLSLCPGRQIYVHLVSQFVTCAGAVRPHEVCPRTDGPCVDANRAIKRNLSATHIECLIIYFECIEQNTKWTKI